MLATIIALACALVSLCLISKRWKLGQKKPLPPGPPGAWLFGNTFQLPRHETWRFHATETLKKYGDVAYFTALGQPMLVLNSYAAAHDLLLKRSSIYSDRPRMVVVGEIMGMDHSTAFCPYGSYWRSHRRIWRQHFDANSLERYTELVETDARQFVANLLDGDKNVYDQVKLWVVKGLLGAAFGKRVTSLSDEFVTMSETVAQEVADAMVPGKFLVELLPILKPVPEWLPGAAWKRMSIDIRNRLTKMGNDPYEHVKATLAAGTAPHSFVSGMIERPFADEESQKWVVAQIYAAGVDTTQEAMNRFVACMMEHPEIQRRAQEEIDLVIGKDRLPNISDKQSLPYIDAIIQEVFRWHMIIPMSIPHKLTQDDEYRGWFIPKGTVVLTNSWAISQNPNEYIHPELFNPDRFIKTNGGPTPLDPRLYCFGVGRRICPGRHFAELSLFAGITTLLATSTIRKPLDEQGAEYMPKVEASGSGFLALSRFKARVEARSPEATALLNEFFA